MAILPIVMDTQFNKLAVIDTYKSLIWTTRYYEHGDFEIQLPANAKNVALLTTGNYIARDDDENVGIIEKVDVKITEANEKLLTISGRFLTAILERRIIAEQTVFNTNVGDVIDSIMETAIVNPEIEERKIENFRYISSASTLTDPIEVQYTGKNIYTVESDLALQYKFGFKVVLDDDYFVFSTYKGTDRSYNQSTNPYVIFSDEYENLVNAEFQKDTKGVVNAVLAAGEGEGLDRKTIWVESDDTPSGLNRFEAYDDDRNVSSNEGEIPEEEYLAELAENGRASLTTYEATFGGEVDFRNVKFKKDVFIGDIVTIESKALGYKMAARIIEVIESVDASGAYQVIPTFGN